MYNNLYVKHVLTRPARAAAFHGLAVLLFHVKPT